MATPTPDERSTGWGRVERAVSLLAAASAIALAAFAWISITQVKSDQALTRDEQITDRYTAAVENLGSQSSEDVRLGGIYALHRLMTDSPRDQPTVIVVLSAFVRGHAQQPPAPSPTVPSPPGNTSQQPAPAATPHAPILTESPNADVAAALSVLSGRDSRHDGTGRIDLSGAYLGGASLDNARLDGAILRSTQLPLAELNGAHLKEANLFDADLSDAKLRHAVLSGANLEDARLAFARMTGADLSGANLYDADMEGTVLYRANLGGANLEQATLDGADLRCANLMTPGRGPAGDAKVTVDQLLSAQVNKDTKLPAELAANEAVKRHMASGKNEEGGCTTDPS